MKKYLLVAALAALSSANGFAAFVNCTVGGGGTSGTLVSGSTSAGNVVFTCSPSATADNIAGDGLDVVGIQLAINLSAQVSGGQSNSLYGVAVLMSNSIGVNDVVPNPTILTFTTGGLGGGSGTTGDLFATVSPVTATDELGAFTVTLNASANGLMPALATAAVYYDAQTVSNAPVPEPTTMALLGFSLLGVGFIRRQK